MTNADKIRQMSDEELAELFVNVISQRDQWWANNLKDVDFELVEIPICSAKIHLDWLREEVNDETDYISRQWLLNEYDKRHKGPPGGARKMIEEAPPADVRPVKEGHWIEDRTDYVCSACGGRVSDEIVFMLQSEELPDYCPNCGADMTGGADG